MKNTHLDASGDHDDIILSARNISKTYGSTRALKNVNFDIRRGSVTTLFGENGAGKSTLMKILSGVILPTSGEIILDGEVRHFSSTTEARENGIAIIHQELNVAPNMNVRDNIFIGREIVTMAGVNFVEEERIVTELLLQLEEDIDPLTPVEELRLGQQQIVEIARALSVNARILIMDEPTSALSAAEVRVLFKIIGDLTRRGVAIVYISHHLEEALEITDQAVVLRDGVMTAKADRSEINLAWIVGHMVGENFDPGSPPQDYECKEQVLALDVEHLCVPGKGRFLAVDHFSLRVKAGEIVCIYGLMGAGRTELMECIAGRLSASSGSIKLYGKEISSLSITSRIKSGLALVPEDRQRDGLIQTMSVGENISLASIRDFSRWLLLSVQREKTLIDDSIRNVTIKTASGKANIAALSGGNQQKVVIGKVLATSPKVILLDEPSRGIDIGAKAEVFRLLTESARKGLAVIYSTSEVGECLSIAHRIIVMSKGHSSAIFDATVSKERIMAASGESVAV